MLTIKHQEKIVINILGDSGDGIQLIGAQLSESGAAHQLDINTLPSFPAEIRAPAGTLSGISSYQLQISEDKHFTSGDHVDVMFAMNPAALKKGLETIGPTTLIIMNQDSLTKFELNKAGYDQNPFETNELSSFYSILIPLTTLTKQSIKHLNLPASQVNKSKNMFALGILSWLFSFELSTLGHWITQKFKHDQILIEANTISLQKGYDFAEISEIFHERYYLKSSSSANKPSCQISGNEAFAFGCLVAASQSPKPFLLAGYPITPASSLLQSVAQYANPLLPVFQAEDEIAALGAVVGASFGGSLALAVTSGPGFDLKTEFLGLAVTTELPLVVINVQRAGPSTGIPTKPEQSDLMAAIYGRHGECPLPVLAPRSPSDCYTILLDAFRITAKYSTPVVILSDAHLANATERWDIPAYEKVNIPIELAQQSDFYQPFHRNKETLGRIRAIPGMAGFEHRIGGLEKENFSGNVSYDGNNHQTMTLLRQEKISKIAMDTEFSAFDFNQGYEKEILIITWGSTFGTVHSAIKQLQHENYSISHLHLRLIYPLPENLELIIHQFKKIIVAELNSGQLSKLIREKYLVDVLTYNKMKGQQLLIGEIYQFIKMQFE